MLGVSAACAQLSWAGDTCQLVLPHGITTSGTLELLPFAQLLPLLPVVSVDDVRPADPGSNRVFITRTGSDNYVSVLHLDERGEIGVNGTLETLRLVFLFMLNDIRRFARNGTPPATAGAAQSTPDQEDAEDVPIRRSRRSIAQPDRVQPPSTPASQSRVLRPLMRRRTKTPDASEVILDESPRYNLRPRGSSTVKLSLIHI